MVFSSVPVFLDPPNWQQQPNHHHHHPHPGRSNDNSHLPPQLQQPTPPPPPPPPPPLPPVGGGSGGAGTIRPGSMADRARLAKLPQPETALKCPRCESTNTKFCYFNNYSLSQPRHFCKTCRRYWTRGGALRNVPVGGGCRRNKRSKGNRSKSPITGERQGGSSSAGAVPSNSCTSDIIGHLPAQPPPPQLPFLPPLHHLTDYGAGDIGLNFPGIHPPGAVSGGGNGGTDIEFPIGSCSGGGGGGPILHGGLAEQWRLQQIQQFPFLAGLEPPSGLYPFEGEGTEPPSYLGGSGQLRAKAMDSGAAQLATVKIEENQGLNLSRNFLGVPGNDHQYWSGNTWNDLSGFTSSTTSHLL